MKTETTSFKAIFKLKALMIFAVVLAVAVGVFGAVAVTQRKAEAVAQAVATAEAAKARLLWEAEERRFEENKRLASERALRTPAQVARDNAQEVRDKTQVARAEAQKERENMRKFQAVLKRYKKEMRDQQELEDFRRARADAAIARESDRLRIKLGNALADAEGR